MFYRFNFFFFYFVSVDERLAMRSQPNLASRSEVLSIYKCPTKISGAFPRNNGGDKKHKLFDHFFATSALDAAYLGNKTLKDKSTY